MPITARLSKRFYETFGDEVTNELVTWFNAADDSYRAQFRDLFNANFGQVRSEMTTLRGEMLSQLALMRTELRTELAALTSRVGTLEARVEKLPQDIANVAAASERQKTELLKWMFVFWCGTLFSAIVIRMWG